MLWRKIRGNRFHGFKFRRQVPIGLYIVDFMCIERKLIIEIDGDSHFGHKQTLQELDVVLMQIGQVLGTSSESPPLPDPLPPGEGRNHP